MERKKIIIVAALAIGIVAWRMGAMQQGQEITLVMDDGKVTLPEHRAILFTTIKDVVEDTNATEIPIPKRDVKAVDVQAVVNDLAWVLRVLDEKHADETEQQLIERIVKAMPMVVPFSQAALEQLIAKVNTVIFLNQPALLERYTKEIADMLVSDDLMRRLVRNDAPIIQYIPSEIVQGLSKYIFKELCIKQDTISHNDKVWSVAVSADGTRVVTGSWDNTAKIVVWNGNAWVKQYTIRHNGPVDSVAISADGTRVVTGCEDKTAKIVAWNGTAWVEQYTISHNDRVWSVAISADGTRVVTGSIDNTAKIVAWNGTGWVEQYTIRHNNEVRSVAVSADGTRVVTGSIDNTAKIVAWNGTAWVEQYTIQHDRWVVSVAVSVDGTRVVTGSWDNTAKIVTWNGNAWVEQDTIRHNGEVTSVAISADGTRVVTGSMDKTAKIVAWNGTAWVEQYTIAHNGTVRPVAISANGNKVVTGSKDKTAKIVAWNGTAWIEQYTIAHNGPVWSVAISADGTRVVTGSWDHKAKIYLCLPASLPGISDFDACLFEHLLLWASERYQKISKAGWFNNILNMIEWQKLRREDQAELKKLIQETVQQ